MEKTTNKEGLKIILSLVNNQWCGEHTGFLSSDIQGVVFTLKCFVLNSRLPHRKSLFLSPCCVQISCFLKAWSLAAGPLLQVGTRNLG